MLLSRMRHLGPSALSSSRPRLAAGEESLPSAAVAASLLQSLFQSPRTLSSSCAPLSPLSCTASTPGSVPPTPGSALALAALSPSLGSALPARSRDLTGHCSAHVPFGAAAAIAVQSRSLFGLPNPFGSFAGPKPGEGRIRKYTERKVLPYTPEQVYNVVASVDQYEKFVPWCSSSRILSRAPGSCRAQLTVSFLPSALSPFVETFVSNVAFVPNKSVEAVSHDTNLFVHLSNSWKFSPGPPLPGTSASSPAGNGPKSSSTIVDFEVNFAFKSQLHASVADLFFNEVVKKMVTAFADRCRRLYG